MKHRSIDAPWTVDMIPESIKHRMGKNLHLKPNHPLEIVKRAIYEVFHDFKKFETFGPVVSVKNNFDDLLIPADHPSRSKSDTYYVDEDNVLRTHTSAHQHELIAGGEMRFLVTGDVYRRDEIDKTHYPVFHQMEGVALFHIPSGSPIGPPDHMERMMKDYMIGMVEKVFGRFGKAQEQPVPKTRFVESYFPFTTPSWELEIDWNGEWLEVAGCGLVHPEVIKRAGNGKSVMELGGWAFGVGLERLAMLVFGIPDIRLFWSEDERFVNQFKDLDSRFKPFSVQPNCYKDMAFWIPAGYSENDFYQIVRDLHGDLVESVKLIDKFSKNGSESHCYRINYRSMDRTLTNEEINVRQQQLRDRMKEMKVVLR